MPRLVRTIPSYRRHKASGQAIVTLCGRDFYLGPHGTKVSRAEYDRVVAEWIANSRRLPDGANAEEHVTVIELIAAFWKHAHEHYRHLDGTPTSEINNFKYSLRPLKQLYGQTLAKDFGPLEFKAVRQRMIESGIRRGVINQRMGRIRRVFRWGVENAMVPPSVFHGLQAVCGLKRGRSKAKDSEPVKPVPEAYVRAILPYVSSQVAAMIELQMLTGMRSGEVTAMRGCDLDTTGEIWAYTPESHKTAHFGHRRVIYLGPHAQVVLKPWLKTDLQAFLFSPAEAESARNAERRRQRKTPMTPSQSKRRPKRHSKRARSDRYTANSYRQAIEYGIAKANREAEQHETEIPHWHPHQLRHNAATFIRKEYGIEAARVVLGHRSPAVTELYAEIDQAKAAEIMLRVG